MVLKKWLPKIFKCCRIIVCMSILHSSSHGQGQNSIISSPHSRLEGEPHPRGRHAARSSMPRQPVRRGRACPSSPCVKGRKRSSGPCSKDGCRFFLASLQVCFVLSTICWTCTIMSLPRVTGSPRQVIGKLTRWPGKVSRIWSRFSSAHLIGATGRTRGGSERDERWICSRT